MNSGQDNTAKATTYKTYPDAPGERQSYANRRIGGNTTCAQATCHIKYYDKEENRRNEETIGPTCNIIESNVDTNRELKPGWAYLSLKI